MIQPYTMSTPSVFQKVGFAIFIIATGFSGFPARGEQGERRERLAQDSASGVEKNLPRILNKVPESFSFKLVRNFTQSVDGKERECRSVVRFYKVQQKWRFELWVGKENKESLNVVQIYNGVRYYLWYSAPGIVKTTAKPDRLDNFPSVFMENFGPFGFLVNRGENPPFTISGANPDELFNPQIWKSALERAGAKADFFHAVPFPSFEGKFDSGRFRYAVQFDRGNPLRPIHISKFSGDSLVAETRVSADDNQEGRVLDLIPRKVKTLGYDRSGKVILKGSTVLEEWNPHPPLRKDLFEVDYTGCDEILDLDNRKSLRLAEAACAGAPMRKSQVAGREARDATGKPKAIASLSRP